MPKGIKGFQKNNEFGKTSWKNRRDYNGENNPHYGGTHTPEVKEKLRILHLNEGSPTWKGDKVQYSAVHEWVRKRKPRPEICPDCKERKPYHLANISLKYKRDINDFEWLCAKCHKNKDMKNRTFNKLTKKYENSQTNKY